MIIAAVLILVIGFTWHWRWAALAATAVALAAWWRQHPMLSAGWLTAQTGVLMALPVVPWAARRVQETRRRELLTQASRAQTEIEQLHAQLARLRQQQDALSSDITQLIELYRVTKETAGAVQLPVFFEELTKILSTVLTFRAWHFLLLAAPSEAGTFAVESAWIGVREAGAILVRPSPSPPAWQESLLRRLRQQTTPAQEHDLAWIPLTFQDRLRAVMVFERLPEAEFARAQIIAHQVALQLERVLLYQELERLAISDSLTDLPVRRFFLQRFEEELDRARRHVSPGALVMMDIDHFKALNDQHGHLVGDEVLRCIGGLIKSNVREIDLTARFGGEEFVMYLVETPQEAAAAVAERMRRMIAEHTMHAYDETVRVSVSGGIAMFPVHGNTATELLEHADQALYQAKALGRNRVVLYETGLPAPRSTQQAGA